jgi:TolB-like protein
MSAFYGPACVSIADWRPLVSWMRRSGSSTDVCGPRVDAVASTPPVAAPEQPSLNPDSAPAVTTAPAPRLSFFVLPFANLSSDPDQEYFADGITDDLTTDLTRISGSFVIARNTAFTYKGKPVDVKQLGRELGVRYVIEGSVRRTGDRVRANVQLIDAETGAHLWADRFDTDRANAAEAQAEITGRLARTLNSELGQDAGRRIEHERAVDPDARDLVMRGWAVGIDINPAYVATAQARFRTRLPHLALYAADIQEALPSIMPVGLIFAGLVLEHVDLGPTMQNLRKLCAPGGTLVTVLQASSAAGKAVSPSPGLRYGDVTRPV